MCSDRHLCVCLCFYVFTSSLTDICSYHFCISLFLSYLFVSVGLEMALCASKGATMLIATLFIGTSFEMGTHRLFAHS
jgi:fatty-acid desaturase